MSKRKEILKKIFQEGFLNYAGFTTEEIDMKKTEKAPHRRQKMKIVTKKDRKIKSLVSPGIKLDYTRKFNAKEFRRLSYGLNHEDKDEKWFIYMEKDRLFFHRSWTGECVFMVKFEKKADRYGVVDALMNKEFNYEPDYAVRFLAYLIDRLLLSRAVAFPFPGQLVDPMERAMFRHGMVGCSKPNEEN
ncbi:hypothetical protein K8S19_05960 [bacterium]|nr:hypothetical protein [bacterium]